MFLDVGQWQIPVESSREHKEIVLKLLDHHRANPDEFPYKEAYFYKMPSEDASVESWMYIHIFDSTEAFLKMEDAQQRMLETEPELKAAMDRAFELMVSDSWRTTQWTRVQESRNE
ncbi:MAG: hypothetical protein ACE5H4_15545 [Candidatus Thorarchaeota archaeon]